MSTSCVTSSTFDRLSKLFHVLTSYHSNFFIYKKHWRVVLAMQLKEPDFFDVWGNTCPVCYLLILVSNYVYKHTVWIKHIGWIGYFWWRALKLQNALDHTVNTKFNVSYSTIANFLKILSRFLRLTLTLTFYICDFARIRNAGKANRGGLIYLLISAASDWR